MTASDKHTRGIGDPPVGRVEGTAATDDELRPHDEGEQIRAREKDAAAKAEQVRKNEETTKPAERTVDDGPGTPGRP